MRKVPITQTRIVQIAKRHRECTREEAVLVAQHGNELALNGLPSHPGLDVGTVLSVLKVMPESHKGYFLGEQMALRTAIFGVAGRESEFWNFIDEMLDIVPVRSIYASSVLADVRAGHIALSGKKILRLLKIIDSSAVGGIEFVCSIFECLPDDGSWGREDLVVWFGKGGDVARAAFGVLGRMGQQAGGHKTAGR